MAFLIVKIKDKYLPSGYEGDLPVFCTLVKSRVLTDLSMKIGEMNFRTFV